MDVTPRAAQFRFYGSLRHFLASSVASPPQEPIRYTFWGQPAVKDAIEAQGVPHPEVDLVLVDGEPVSFDHPLSEGNRVSVYPWIQSLPRPETSLRPSVPSPPSFVCDVHLGQLARYLRMLGFDTRYDTENADPLLARVSANEDRILLTRDLGLLKRSEVRLGMFVRVQEPRTQIEEVVARLDITDAVDPLSLCMECNVDLEPAPGEAVDEQVPPRAREAHDEYVHCPSCDSVYWPGTHVERMRTIIDAVTSMGEDNTSSSGATGCP